MYRVSPLEGRPKVCRGSEGAGLRRDLAVFQAPEAPRRAGGR